MLLKPHKDENYATQSLRDLLPTITLLIRNYVSTLKSQTPNLITQANRLWELKQRYRLVIGVEEAAANSLLTASHEVYQQICQTIQAQHEALDEISRHIADLELQQEGCQLTEYSDSVAWLVETLRMLQTQSKYLELQTRSLHPAAIEITAVKQLQKDLQLIKEFELHICMGSAKTERIISK